MTSNQNVQDLHDAAGAAEARDATIFKWLPSTQRHPKGDGEPDCALLLRLTGARHSEGADEAETIDSR